MSEEELDKVEDLVIVRWFRAGPWPIEATVFPKSATGEFGLPSDWVAVSAVVRKVLGKQIAVRA